ncbi:MAG: hypothetical protein ABIA63_00960 [bacterium]
MDYTQFVHLNSGRIWAILGVETRRSPDFWAVVAKYSDDDGTNWLPWQPGRIAAVPGTYNGVKQGIHPKGLVPYRNHIAVFWGHYVKEGNKYQTKWTYYNGQT